MNAPPVADGCYTIAHQFTTRSYEVRGTAVFRLFGSRHAPQRFALSTQDGKTVRSIIAHDINAALRYQQRDQR